MSKTMEIGPYSAYAIAVKYGYTGTEEQWVKEQEANRVASEQAAQQAEQAQEGAEAAAARAETARQQTEGVRTDALDKISAAKSDALDAVAAKQASATAAVDTAKTSALNDMEAAKSAAVKAVTDTQSTATQAVDAARDEAVKQVDAATEAAKTAASEASTSAGNASQSAQQAADSLQELKDGIASGNFKGEKGEKGDKGDTGPQGPKGDTGPAVALDTTLTHEGEAADAKATGDKISKLKEDMGYAYAKKVCPELIKNNNLASGGGYTKGTFSQNGNVFSSETAADISINFNVYGKKILVFWKLSKAAYTNLRFSAIDVMMNATSVTYKKANEYEKAVLVAPEKYPYICILGIAGADTTVYLLDVSNLTETQIAAVTSDMAENDAVVFNDEEIVKIQKELHNKAELQAQNTLNLFDKWSNGYIDGDGNLSVNPAYYCTDSIAIDGQKTISVYGLNKTSSALHCACYDKDGTYLGKEISTQGNGYPSFMLMTRPETRHVRVYWRVSQTENISLVAIYLGASASTIGYIPHTKESLPEKNIYYENIPRFSLKTGWCRKKIAILGDSLTENPRQIRYIDAVFGSISEWHGIGGGRISGASSNAFWQDSCVESLPIDADCIIVAGGTNDRSSYNLGEISKDNVDTSTLCGAINVLLSKIFYKYMKVGYYDSIDYTGLTQVNSAKNVTVCFALPPYQGSDATDHVNTISNDIEKCLAMWNIASVRQGAFSGINAMNSRHYFKHAEDGSLTDATHGLDAFGERNARAIVKMLKDLEPLAEVDLVTN